MTLLEQCQVWHIHDQHQKIFDAIEALPPEQRTADTTWNWPGPATISLIPRHWTAGPCSAGPIGLMEAIKRSCRTPTSGISGWGTPTIIWTRRAWPLRYFTPGPGPASRRQPPGQHRRGSAVPDYGLPGAAGIALVPAQLPGAHLPQPGLLLGSGSLICARRWSRGKVQQASDLCRGPGFPLSWKNFLFPWRPHGSQYQLCCSAAGSLPLSAALGYFQRQMPGELRARWAVAIRDVPSVTAAFAPGPDAAGHPDRRGRSGPGSFCPGPLLRPARP